MKDPAPEKAGLDAIMRMLKSLDASSFQLQKLNKLCLSGLGFTSPGVAILGQAVTKLRGLQHLGMGVVGGRGGGCGSGCGGCGGRGGW